MIDLPKLRHNLCFQIHEFKEELTVEVPQIV